MGSQPSWVLSLQALRRLEIGLPWALACQASACADATPGRRRQLHRLEIGLSGHSRAGRRPAPTPPPFGAGPLRRLEIGLPGHWCAGRQPPLTLFAWSAKADHWQQAQEGWLPVTAETGPRRRPPVGAGPLRRLEIGLPGHRCAGRRPAPTPPPFGEGPLRRLEIGLPWALMCRASASADAIRLVGEGRPLAAGPGRV